MKNGRSDLFQWFIYPSPIFQWSAIVIPLVLITVAHNSIYLASYPFQMIIVHKLFFIPVILAGFWKNVRGGLSVALIAAFLYPHRGEMEMHGPAHDMFLAGQTSDIVLLFIVGGMMGLLRNLLGQELERHRLTAIERDAALSEALENFKVARKKDRLAVLGEMVAGIAHEVGNPLTGMLSSIEVLKRSTGKDTERVNTLLEILEKEINRLDKIVRRFLEFARTGEPVMQKYEPCKLVEETTDFMRHQFERSGFSLKIEQEKNNPPIECDPAQISQIIINLLINAIQFAREESEIVVTSSTESDFWKLVVQNQGSPMPENLRGRIFEPFVTTRSEGTGLGLAVAHRIAENHGGSLSFSCKSKGRTDFILQIPLAT